MSFDYAHFHLCLVVLLSPHSVTMCHCVVVASNTESTPNVFYSGLDKDLDQWVFHPLLFNLMIILLHI